MSVPPRPRRPAARPAKARKGRRGFTLIEVLLVLAILGVIAALVIPNLLGRQESANINATKVSIKGFESAVQSYAIDHNGQPPSGSQEEAVQQLMNPESLDGRQLQPYLTEIPKDGWGRPLFYSYPGSHQMTSTDADIWSGGANGQNEDGSGDDITNWETVGT